MKKNLAFSFFFLSLIMPGITQCADGIFNQATAQLVDALTSKFAIGIYVGVATHTGAHIVKTLLKPVLQTYLEKTNSEDPQIQQLRLALVQQTVAIDKEVFEYHQEKIKILKHALTEYETIQAKNCEAIRKSTQLSEQEKQTKINEIESKLNTTKAQLDAKYTKLYESMVGSTERFANNNTSFTPAFVR